MLVVVQILSRSGSPERMILAKVALP